MSFSEKHKMLIKLEPHIVCKIWGGNRLAPLRNAGKNQNVGESWEVSVLPEGESIAQGIKLSKVIDPKFLPYLIKLIDTNDYLSVQVHPDENYANKFENSQGKTECWLILDAGPKAGIYLGFKEGVTKESFEKAIRANEDLTPYLRFFPVKRGDFFFVPAGSVHAIGKDVFLVEVQESSGITYRVWDWNRLESGKPRSLHIEKALDVLNFETETNKPMSFCVRENLFSYNGEEELLKEKLFKLNLINITSNEIWERDLSSLTRHQSFMCLEGTGKLCIEGEELAYGPYCVILIPSNVCGLLEIKADLKSSFIFVS